MLQISKMVICLMVLKCMLKEDSKNVLVLMESELTRILAAEKGVSSESLVSLSVVAKSPRW